eukprot:CAMPEP_0206444538 /NCGR_PEP_ID=MMETSP0324_2-20121206/14971_1 /ASSEMBLY_ACC=CAM_ASM_000836 /TAXON_ID=2866 /ORGANISM="Crypthecodinium cohnii, Strain Seligo" /LENGTH=1154 /DNA_ID=CAMNT_0053912579 /DNA_START=137 /DNA_END=3604 /DNA_ORIENTATION=-
MTAAVMKTPPVQVGTLGRPELLVANHFHLALRPSRTAKIPLKWYLWQVTFPEDKEAEEAAAAAAAGRDQGKGAGKGKGKARKKKAEDEDADPPRRFRDAAIDLVMRRVEDAAWIYDGARQLWVRQDEQGAMVEIASEIQSVKPDICRSSSILVSFSPTKEDGDDQTQRTINLDNIFRVNLDDTMLVEKQFLQVALAGFRSKISSRRHTGPVLELISKGRRSIFPGRNRELFDLEEVSLAHGRQLWWGFTSQINFVTGADGKKSMVTLSLNMVPTVGLPEMEAIDFLAVILAENYSKSVRDRDSNTKYYADQMRKNIFPNDLTQSRLKSTLMSEAGLRKIKVSVNYFGHERKKQIVGISDKGADNLRFAYKEEGASNGTISVADYFKIRYRKNLTFPKLPCLALGTDSNWVPIELVKIMGGEHNILAGKMRQEYQGDVVKVTAMSPASRKNSIEKSIALNNYGPGASLELLGIDTESKLATVEGRVLPPPKLKGGKDTEVTIGNYSNRLTANRVPGFEIKWGLWSFAKSRDSSYRDITPDLDDLRDALWYSASNMGVKFARPSFCEVPEAAHEAFHSRHMTKWHREVEDELWRQCKQHGIHLLVVVLPEKSEYANQLRGFLKTTTETDPDFYKFGVVTQCVCYAGPDAGKGGSKGKGKGTSAKANNLMMKILPKLPFSPNGKGCCHAVELSQVHPLLQVPTMVVGADVTHHVGGVSIAGIVATRDRSFINYFSHILAQSTHDEDSQKVRTRQSQEKIVNLDVAMEHLMKEWREVNSGRLPQHIFYYRDGVSDGQFLMVLRHEYNKLVEAFRRVGGDDYKPKVAVIVGQKRHPTRFFKAGKAGGKGAASSSGGKGGKGGDKGGKGDQGKGKGKAGFECQPDPGTAVSGGLCDLGHLNFYLVSQNAGLGTAVPCHYHVLHLDDFRLPDKTKAGINDLQRITYDLCHLYSRSDKAVGYAAPAYLADHLAERGKDWLESQYSLSDTASSGSAEDPMKVQERVRWLNSKFSEFSNPSWKGEISSSEALQDASRNLVGTGFGAQVPTRILPLKRGECAFFLARMRACSVRAGFGRRACGTLSIAAADSKPGGNPSPGLLGLFPLQLYNMAQHALPASALPHLPKAWLKVFHQRRAAACCAPSGESMAIRGRGAQSPKMVNH